MDTFLTREFKPGIVVKYAFTSSIGQQCLTMASLFLAQLCNTLRWKSDVFSFLQCELMIQNEGLVFLENADIVLQ